MISERQPTVHLLHGIRVSDPMKDIGRLKPCLQYAGFENVVVEGYGYLPFGFAWLRNRGIAEKLLSRINPLDIIVGHSNAAILIELMLEMGLKLSGAVLLNPAIDADKALPDGVDWVHVYYNEDDAWTWLSKFIPLHYWGNQGQVGFTGQDFRYRQFNTKTTSSPLSGHTGYWSEEHFPVWCPLLGKNTWDAHVAHQTKKAAS